MSCQSCFTDCQTTRWEGNWGAFKKSGDTAILSHPCALALNKEWKNNNQKILTNPIIVIPGHKYLTYSQVCVCAHKHAQMPFVYLRKSVAGNFTSTS